MQVAAQYEFSVHQMDVKTAFLNAPIDREIYMDQPEGYVANTPNIEGARQFVDWTNQYTDWNNLVETGTCCYINFSYLIN